MIFTITLSSMYEKSSISNNIYLMRQLFNLYIIEDGLV